MTLGKFYIKFNVLITKAPNHRGNSSVFWLIYGIILY